MAIFIKDVKVILVKITITSSIKMVNKTESHLMSVK